ncbi:MAG: GNAT family N-acetyltransferase [Acidimicrobiia bacterium]|nr:GNAT family N-acetyltransferase [Acidimicrobiia bacterium]
MNQRLRESQPEDLPFLREMLHEAVFWRAGADMPSLAEGLVLPEVVRSLENWGERAGDTGVVATVGSTPVGAAWYRLWTDDNYIRGYVNQTTPVLVIGVRRDYRRRGVGGMLIDWLVARASAHDIQRISLAVSKDNHALRLYRHRGFAEYVDMGDTILMVRSLETFPGLTRRPH